MSNNHLRLFTSESVTEGHPDKICDQISDAILDGIIAQDPAANVAVETMVTTGQVHVAGEVTTSSYVEIPSIVRETILGIGYDSSTRGFDGEFCGVSVSIGEQSPDINAGVYESLEVRQGIAADEYDRQGAGDQGIMFGYASNETNVLMPAPIWLAHRLSERLTKVRKDGLLTELRPDGKTQVTSATIRTMCLSPWTPWLFRASTPQATTWLTCVQTLRSTLSHRFWVASSWILPTLSSL